MNLNQLAIFKAVAESGGVGKGADRLMISQPAVSKQLRQFERALGVTLFDRLPGGMRLTAAGEALLPFAKRLFAIETEAERALDELKGLRQGRLAIGASMTIGVYLLPDRIAAFQKAFPGIEIRWEIGNTEQIQQLLADGALDVALTEGAADRPELQAEVFRADQLLPVVRPDHPLLKQKGLAARDFLAEPLLMREVGSGTRLVVEQALLARGFAARPAMSLASTEAIKRAVAAGVGVAIVSELAIRNEIASGQLVVLPLKDLKIERPLHRVELKGKDRSATAKAFIRWFDALEAAFRGRPAKR